MKATAAIREALGRFDSFADVCEMRVAAKEVVQPFRQAVEKRQLDARLVSWALRELPWSRTERDEARIRRECSEILADLPSDLSEADGKEALEPTVKETCIAIERRHAEIQRQTRKASLVQLGVSEVSSYLLELNRDGELSDEEYWDNDSNAELKEIVREGLESELTGDESTKGARKVAREIIDGELD